MKKEQRLQHAVDDLARENDELRELVAQICEWSSVSEHMSSVGMKFALEKIGQIAEKALRIGGK